MISRSPRRRSRFVQKVPCGLTKVVLKDSLVDEEDGIADELTLSFNLTATTPATKITTPRSTWSDDDDNAVEVLAEVRASSHKHEAKYSYVRAVGVDNSLFYFQCGPQIRNMCLGKYRQQELYQYFDSIQGGYCKRVHLTCLAIHGYWPELPKVLERTSTSLKLLAVRDEVPKGGVGTGKSDGRSVSQMTLFTRSKVTEYFLGDRLVLVHQTEVVDEEVRKLMAPSRCYVVTFASDHEAWDRIVSDLFSANKS